MVPFALRQDRVRLQATVVLGFYPWPRFLVFEEVCPDVYVHNVVLFEVNVGSKGGHPPSVAWVGAYPCYLACAVHVPIVVVNVLWFLFEQRRLVRVSPVEGDVHGVPFCVDLFCVNREVSFGHVLLVPRRALFGVDRFFRYFHIFK